MAAGNTKIKSTASAEEVPDWATVEGHELLRAPGKVKGSDQIRLIGKLKNLGFLEDEEGDGADTEVDILSLDLEGLADFIDWVSDKFALDPEKFDEFTSGEEGYLKAIQLTIAYAATLGKAGK